MALLLLFPLDLTLLIDQCQIAVPLFGAAYAAHNKGTTIL